MTQRQVLGVLIAVLGLYGCANAPSDALLFLFVMLTLVGIAMVGAKG